MKMEIMLSSTASIKTFRGRIVWPIRCGLLHYKLKIMYDQNIQTLQVRTNLLKKSIIYIFRKDNLVKKGYLSKFERN